MAYFSIQNFFSFFQVESNFKSSYEKFNYYKLNADLLENIQWQMFQCVICLLLISIISLLKRVFYYHIFTNSFVKKMSIFSKCIKNQYVAKISNGLYKLAKSLLSIEQFATFNGVKKLLLINGWDLLFKTFLYLQSIDSINVRDSISIVLSICILTAYFLIIISACNRETSIQNGRQKILLVKRYEILNLLRQTCFLMILVFLQKQEILQIMLITFICILCLKIVYNYRKVFEMQNFLVQFIVEGSIQIISLL